LDLIFPNSYHLTYKMATVDKKVQVSWVNDIKSGEFKRTDSVFRDWIKSYGSTKFVPEANRYHLYISLACPWAHRTLIVRKLKGLEKIISVNVVHYFLGEGGWQFDPSVAGATLDEVNNFKFLREVYEKAVPGYYGKYTVPVLFDKKLQTIVNNESSEIIRMLNSEFNTFAEHPELDLYPENLRKEIDEVNSWIYTTINNGVYKCGFATAQSAYDQAYVELFNSLDRVEDILSKNRFLTGKVFTEADVRLFTTLLRFDPVYHGHFKCNKKKLMEYPNISEYLRDLYQIPGISETVNLTHIKNHYYMSHKKINPTGIVPKGPEPYDLSVPHNRAKLSE